MQRRTLNSTSIVRSYNVAAVLQTLHRVGSCSRSDLTQLTRMSPATISRIVAQLMRQGIVVEERIGVSTGGRPPVILRLDYEKLYVLMFGLVVGGEAPAAAQSDDEVITLTVLNYHDNTAATARREQTEIWDRFAELYPNIRIQREDLFLEPFHQKVEAYAAANQVPDVMYMWPGGRSTTLHRNHLVKDLRPLVGDKADEFSPAALVDQAGGYLGMSPIGLTSTHVIFVNHDLLDELGLDVPETYEDLEAMVPVVRAARKELIVMGAEDDWVMQSVLFSMIAGRLAGNEFFDGVLAGKANLTDAPFVFIVSCSTTVC